MNTRKNSNRRNTNKKNSNKKKRNNNISDNLNYYIDKLCKTKKNKRYYLIKIKRTLREEEEKTKELKKQDKKYICTNRMGTKRYFNNLEKLKKFIKENKKRYNEEWYIEPNRNWVDKRVL